MKLHLKMTLLFSVIMIIAILTFSSYTVKTNTAGANAFTQSRFANMSVSIAHDIKQDFHMMSMTLDELTENTFFMAALNQFVRDDSDDLKMGNAARVAALQQLYQSPMAENYYRVTFISLDGVYLTNLADKDLPPFTASPELLDLYLSLDETGTWVTDGQYFIVPPHMDTLSPRQDILVYGIAQPVQYHGTTLGYISILSECINLNHIMNFVDNSQQVEVHAIFDDGSVLFTSNGTERSFPSDLSMEGMQSWTDTENNVEMEVLHTRVESLGLNLYIAQDGVFTRISNKSLRTDVVKHSLWIMVPAIAAIILVTFSLTRSIRLLTKKVQQTPANSVLAGDESAAQALSTMVTTSRDREIYTLEQTYNNMMLRLRESTIQELALREGTLQAQLSALQAQINPHFIYNTLNIISAKAMESGNFDIIELCDQFASMLRYSTDMRSKTATLQEEIENVRNYLLLSKARYEDNLEFTIDVPDNLNSIYVPKLSLQPLVENALTHGYDGSNVKRVLSVTGKITDGKLILEVHDNDTGFSEDILKNLRQRIEDIEAGKVSFEEFGGHIGLLNTCLRLHHYSKGAIRMAIRNENGAVITLTMPVGM